MAVRATPDFVKIMENFDRSECVVVYSMWEGYKKGNRMRTFLEGFDCVDIHTSGHADIQTIKDVCRAVSPRKVIPIHCTKPEDFNTIGLENDVLILQDGEVLEFSSSVDEEKYD